MKSSTTGRVGFYVCATLIFSVAVVFLIAAISNDKPASALPAKNLLETAKVVTVDGHEYFEVPALYGTVSYVPKCKCNKDQSK